VEKILILSASFGEGHNSAARGIRDSLARVAPNSEIELRDLFAETYGALNEFIRRSYLGLINRWPRSWGYVYRWLDRKNNFDKDFARFSRLKNHFASWLERFQPDVVVSTFHHTHTCSSRSRDRTEPAKVLSLSRIPSRSTPSGTAARPSSFSFRMNKARPSSVPAGSRWIRLEDSDYQ